MKISNGSKSKWIGLESLDAVLDFLYAFQKNNDIGALVKQLTDRMEKTKSERSQLQTTIDEMEHELR